MSTPKKTKKELRAFYKRLARAKEQAQKSVAKATASFVAWKRQS